MYVRHAADILREEMQYGYWTNNNVRSDSFGDPLLLVQETSSLDTAQSYVRQGFRYLPKYNA